MAERNGWRKLGILVSLVALVAAGLGWYVRERLGDERRLAALECQRQVDRLEATVERLKERGIP